MNNIEVKQLVSGTELGSKLGVVLCKHIGVAKATESLESLLSCDNDINLDTSTVNLDSAFVWSATPQGHNYWKGIDRDIRYLSNLAPSLDSYKSLLLMNNKQLRDSKLGRTLCRAVGTRKAIKLLRSLHACGDPYLGLKLDDGCLLSSFSWISSPQGKAYWNNVWVRTRLH